MRGHKGLYRHKTSGDLFAIEFDGDGKVISTSGPLLTAELDPEKLDYDNYFRTEIREVQSTKGEGRSAKGKRDRRGIIWRFWLRTVFR